MSRRKRPHAGNDPTSTVNLVGLHSISLPCDPELITRLGLLWRRRRPAEWTSSQLSERWSSASGPGSPPGRESSCPCVERSAQACLAAMSSTRPIVFLSDFGLGNEWVGICHAVMSGAHRRRRDAPSMPMQPVGASMLAAPGFSTCGQGRFASSRFADTTRTCVRPMSGSRDSRPSPSTTCRANVGCTRSMK